MCNALQCPITAESCCDPLSLEVFLTEYYTCNSAVLYEALLPLSGSPITQRQQCFRVPGEHMSPHQAPEMWRMAFLSPLRSDGLLCQSCPVCGPLLLHTCPEQYAAAKPPLPPSHTQNTIGCQSETAACHSHIIQVLLKMVSPSNLPFADLRCS